MRRSWVAARQKVELEGSCRWCGFTEGIQAAHIIPRSRVSAGPGEDPRNIVPLCLECHALFDGLCLDLTGALTREEQAYAVELVGITEAMRRLSGRRWEPVAA